MENAFEIKFNANIFLKKCAVSKKGGLQQFLSGMLATCLAY
jgi:hypothetical protein